MLPWIQTRIQQYLSTSNKQQNSKSSAAVASGEDGDLLSDLEPPARSRKTRIKKPAGNVNKPGGFTNLDFSDDSDFDFLPTTVKSVKEKKSKRRSFLPPVQQMTSEKSPLPPDDLNDCTDFFNEYMEKIKTENCGSFFPTLNTNNNAREKAEDYAPRQNAAIMDDSCIIVSDEEAGWVKGCVSASGDCKNDVGIVNSPSSSSQAAMDTKSLDVRPKIKDGYGQITPTKTRSNFVSGSDSDSDSLLSPPKKSKASHLADERKLAKKNLQRIGRADSFGSPEAPKRSKPAGLGLTYIVSSQSSGTLSPPPPPPLARRQSPMTVEDSDDSSDLDEEKWERAIMEMSRPYIDLSAVATPSPRRKKKATRRRSSAAAALSSSSSLHEKSNSKSTIPNVVITDVQTSTSHPPSHVASFNLAPTIQFTSTDQPIAFRGASVADTTATKSSSRNCDTSTRHQWSCDSSLTCDSPLTNMITDMAIQDVDFDTEMTPPTPQQPPRPVAPIPCYPGFKSASSMLTSDAAPNSFFPLPSTSSSSSSTTSTSSSGSSSVQNSSSSSSSNNSGRRRTSSRLQQQHQRHLGRPRRFAPLEVEPDDDDDDEDEDYDFMLLGAVGGSGAVRGGGGGAGPSRRDRSRRLSSSTKKSIHQMESDEAMARRLQEEMDLEFASHLANAPPTPKVNNPTQQPSPPRPSRPHNRAIRQSRRSTNARHQPAIDPSSHTDHNMERIMAMSDYDFAVHLALVQGDDIPQPEGGGGGQHTNLEDVVDTEVMAFIETVGVDYVQRERLHRQQENNWSGVSAGGAAAFMSPTVIPSRSSRRRNDNSHAAYFFPSSTGGFGPRQDYFSPVVRLSNMSYQRLQGGGPSNDNYEDLLALGDAIGDARNRGMSDGQISELPQRTYKKENKEDGEEEEAMNKSRLEIECNICCSEYVDDEKLRRLPCLHEYHTHCIDTWIKKNPTCPVCRVDVVQMLNQGASSVLPS